MMCQVLEALEHPFQRLEDHGIVIDVVDDYMDHQGAEGSSDDSDHSD